MTPQQRLAQAIRTLEARRSVSAKIRQEVDLFEKKLFGSGSYIEQQARPVVLLKLDLKLQLGDATSSFVQVCDGKYLWSYRDLLGKEKLTRLDAVRASEALQEAKMAAANGRMDALPGLGGLAKLLRGLNANFDFHNAQKGEFRSGESGKLAVWRLRGTWRPEKLAALLPDQNEALKAGEAADLSKLPDHLPDHVILFLGEDDRFPYRIEYRRATSGSGSISDETPSRALVTMDLFDVHFDEPIDSASFNYNPADRKYADVTKEFLKRLKGKE